MLALFQRTLVVTPSRYARCLTTISEGSSTEKFESSRDDDGENYLADDNLLLESAGAGPSQASPSSSPPEPATEAPRHRPAYLDLPDHKIFLDIPPAEDPLIRYLTSILMHDGKRHTAEKRVSRMLLFLHTLTRSAPLPLFQQAIMRVAPDVRVVRHRPSTKEIIIPVALKEKQRVRFAVQWLLKASDNRGGRTVEERLAREIVLVLNGTSQALNQKDAMHKLAMVNRGNIPTPRQ